MGKIASTILKSCKQVRIECGEFEPFKAKIDLPGQSREILEDFQERYLQKFSDADLSSISRARPGANWYQQQAQKPVSIFFIFILKLIQA